MCFLDLQSITAGNWWREKESSHPPRKRIIKHHQTRCFFAKSAFFVFFGYRSPRKLYVSLRIVYLARSAPWNNTTLQRVKTRGKQRKKVDRKEAESPEVQLSQRWAFSEHSWLLHLHRSHLEASSYFPVLPLLSNLLLGHLVKTNTSGTMVIITPYKTVGLTLDKTRFYGEYASWQNRAVSAWLYGATTKEYKRPFLGPLPAWNLF